MKNMSRLVRIAYSYMTEFHIIFILYYTRYYIPGEVPGAWHH